MQFGDGSTPATARALTAPVWEPTMLMKRVGRDRVTIASTYEASPVCHPLVGGLLITTFVPLVPFWNPFSVEPLLFAAAVTTPPLLPRLSCSAPARAAASAAVWARRRSSNRYPTSNARPITAHSARTDIAVIART